MTTEAPSGARSIVVGVDGSECSKKALEWAAQEARLRHLPLEVLATWEYPNTYGWPAAWPENFDLAADTKKMLDETVHAVFGERADIEILETVVEGQPAPVLVQRSADAELVVVGSRGHGGFTGLLIGSVSEHLAAHAQCPVMIVHLPRATETHH